MAYFPIKGGNEDEGTADQMTELMGPGHIDQFIRQAIHFCWMALPKDRKNVDEVEKQTRRIFERAIRDFREDSDAFRRGV